HGQLTGTPPNLTYSPTTNYFGPDEFTFTVRDDLAESAPATASIVVRPVNDPPLAHGQSLVVGEDSARSISWTATDADGDALSWTIAQSPAHGTLSGTPPNVTYQPETNYFGPDSFTFTVNDSITDSAPTTVTIEVRPVNDPPLARFTIGPLFNA